MSSGTVGNEQCRLSTHSTWRLHLNKGIHRNMLDTTQESNYYLIDHYHDTYLSTLPVVALLYHFKNDQRHQNTPKRYSKHLTLENESTNYKCCHSREI